MTSPTRIAVPIISGRPSLREQLAAARAAGADLAELRVDLIRDVQAVTAVLRGHRPLPLILTVRSAAEGGAWTAGEPARVETLLRLAAERPDYLDVELATWRADAQLRAALAALPARPQLILSHHDLGTTPTDLAAVCDLLADTPADILKAVFTAHDAADALRVLSELRRRAATRPTILLAMGEAGLATRVLARSCGAFLTFAALDPRHGSAPGQPTLAELRSVYRWDALGPDTRVYGVVGWPVAHSQSPLIHNAALAAAHIDAVYLPLPVAPGSGDFARFMHAADVDPARALRGLSVTIPHKEHAFRWLLEHGHTCTPRAYRCAAVNTLIRDADGTWSGDNTDVAGVLAALRASPGGLEHLRGRPAAVLGAGGAARAVLAALADLACPVTIYNRSAARAAQLAQEMRCDWRPWDQRQAHAAEMLFNCTAVGMWPAVDESPLPEAALHPGMLVFDTIYRPAETCLLRIARARGCEVVDGVAMFIGQAEEQFRRWHGADPPQGRMRAALGA